MGPISQSQALCLMTMHGVKTCRSFYTGHTGSLNSVTGMKMVWVMCSGICSHQMYGSVYISVYEIPLQYYSYHCQWIWCCLENLLFFIACNLNACLSGKCYSIQVGDKCRQKQVFSLLFWCLWWGHSPPPPLTSFLGKTLKCVAWFQVHASFSHL